MLKKLLKVEWMSTGRTLAILDLGVLCINAAAALMMAIAAFFPVVGSQAWYSTIVGFLMFFSFLGIFIMIAGTVFINIRSFYNLLGQRGYLMLTLPVTINQHIFSKLLYAVLSTIVSLLFAFLDANILAAGSGENLALTFNLSGDFAFVDVEFFLFFSVFAVLMLAAGYLFFYLCVAIGGQWPQQRLLASIASYFVLQFVLQIVSFVLVIIFSCVTISAGNSDQIRDSVGMMLNVGNGSVAIAGVMLLVVLLSAAWNAILWAVTRYLMTKKLNLA